jgi:translocation and assembly module TamB
MSPRLRHALRVAALATLSAAAFLLLLERSGLPRIWMRRAVIRQIEKMTGGAAELGEFRFSLWRLRAELFDLTVHGSEPASAPPFFHAAYLRADLRILSLLGRRVALDELRMDHPALSVRFQANGVSNVPHPRGRGAPRIRPAALNEELFNLSISSVQILGGTIRWNEARTPLSLDAQGFRFLLRLDAPAPDISFYRGELECRKLRLQAGRSIPFPSDLDARFSLGRDSFSLDEFSWRPPRSELRGRAALSSFTRPVWTISYQAKLDFQDIREFMRLAAMPEGRARASGEVRWDPGAAGLSGWGQYEATDIALSYPWFHGSGLSSRARFELQHDRLVVPEFHAEGLGGEINGRVEMLYRELRFRVESDLEGASLSAILSALNHPGFPIGALHWESRVAVHAVTSWEGNFAHLDSRGAMQWTPPSALSPGVAPATAHVEFHFSRDSRAADFSSGLITEPGVRVEFSGRLGGRESGLQLDLAVGDLLAFDDFINALRGVETKPERIGGRGSWSGRISGPLGGPTIAGHARVVHASYADLLWDELEGDLSYSPDALELRNVRATRGRASSDLFLELALSDWSFLPENSWKLDLHLAHADVDGLQSLFGTAYPVHGLISGRVQGRGTRDAPEFDSDLLMDQPVLAGFGFDSAKGQLRWTGQELHAHNLELLQGTGRATGSLDYDRDTEWLTFDLRGKSIALDNFPVFAPSRMPATGRVSFEARGEGPLHSPRGSGTFQLSNLRIGEDVFGDFTVRAQSDGSRVLTEITSAMTHGGVNGHVELTLAPGLPVTGELQLQDVDLDSFLKVALHLRDLTGRSNVSGRLQLTGEVLGPSGIRAQMELSLLSFDYAFVKLENIGPVQLTYGHDEVQVKAAHLSGPDTDLTLSGYAHFARDRLLALNLAGLLSLRLLSGLFPALEARGPAELDVALQGTTAHPRLAGRLRLLRNSATFADFPVALSEVAGDVLFDINRLTFENVQAQVGGGHVQLSGSAVYGEGPFSYDVAARGRNIRVRYPEGMSWLVNGELRLQGNTASATLGGRLVVERLLLTQGLDLSGLISAKGQPTAGASDYLRNLQLDVETTSSSDAQVQWNAARFPSDAQLRIRGTAERPLILGHVHLLAGEFSFRGNTFRLTRGDINFANPFKLDPVVDLEAATTVQQYDVTVHLSGPGSRLQLTYHSDPPLPSSDVITLLALGRASTATGLRTTPTTSPSDQGAQALLSEAVSSQVSGRVEKLFGVSRFSVDPGLTGVGATQTTTARITVQQRISHDLTVTYVTDVTSTQRQVIQIEYNLSRKFSIVALRDENDTYGVDLVIRKYFK